MSDTPRATLSGQGIEVPVVARCPCDLAAFLFRVNPAIEFLVLRRRGHEDVYYVERSLAHIPGAFEHAGGRIWSVAASLCHGYRVSPAIDALRRVPLHRPFFGPVVGQA